MPIALGLALVVGFTSCNNDDEPMKTKTNSVAKVIEDDATFNTLSTAIKAADLYNALSGAGPFTVFAPTNDAFGEYLGDNKLTADALIGSADLSNILKYHVVSGKILSGDVKAGPVASLTGDKFYISIDPNGKVWINGNAMLTAVDKMADNGVIHTLDYVITKPTKTIAEIAIDASKGSKPEFTQLVAALSRAGLVEAVSGGKDDNLTVFAPTDAAFQALYGALGVSNVNEIPLDVLKNVLLYHVVPVRAFSQDLRNGAMLPTLLEGKQLTVDLPNLKINDSKLVASMLNLHAVNGVVHVIDNVMLPK